jgi:hypothetical protein
MGEFGKKIQEDLDKKRQKQQLMREMKENEKLKECTFKPKTNETRKRRG